MISQVWLATYCGRGLGINVFNKIEHGELTERFAGALKEATHKMPEVRPWDSNVSICNICVK